ncbi:MAG TPA: hypothetical protein VMU77_05250, partial [Acidimicrobiales bacterium]|nr:hypothetical protein [Acidimicrobiales bacterium]
AESAQPRTQPTVTYSEIDGYCIGGPSLVNGKYISGLPLWGMQELSSIKTPGNLTDRQLSFCFRSPRSAGKW